MKNIFVVTWYRSENFGTCLQAYALNTVLKNMGCRTLYLDRRTYYPLYKIQYPVKKAVARLQALFAKKAKTQSGSFSAERAIKRQKTEDWIREEFNTVSLRSRNDIAKTDDFADCYLVGSDQMWSPWMLSPQYLLDFVPRNSKKPKYSYAASFGVDNIPENKKSIYRRYLSDFTRISVREPRAAELVDELSGKQADVVLDPAFLLTSEEWRAFADRSSSRAQYGKKKYVLCYFIGSRDFDHIETAKRIAEGIGCGLVVLPMKDADFQISDPSLLIAADACPYDFVSLIDNAELVCTDSFHAVVFSFLMGTAFYCFPRFKAGDQYSQNARLDNIMERFSLKESFWSEGTTAEQIEEHVSRADYSAGCSELNKERERCILYLKNLIEGRL